MYREYSLVLSSPLLSYRHTRRYETLLVDITEGDEFEIIKLTVTVALGDVLACKLTIRLALL